MVSEVQAQPIKPHVSFLQYKNVDGFEGSVIQTMVQDKAGYLWMGAEKGLFKYDGYQFVQMGKDSELADSSISALTIDAMGHLWIGASTGVFFLDKATGALKKIPSPDLNVRALLMDQNEIIWVGTNQGLFYIDSQNLVKFSLENDEFITIYSLLESPNGKLLAGFSGGLHVINQSRNVSKLALTYIYF